MDFGIGNSGTVIAQSTSGYLVEFLPIILLVAGIALALGIIERIVHVFFDRNDSDDKV